MNENSRPVDAIPKRVPSIAEIQDWLVAQLARELLINPNRIRVDQPILSYGIDSMQLVIIIANMEDWLGLRFSGNPLEDHSTIAALSQFVADRCSDPHRTRNDR